MTPRLFRAMAVSDFVGVVEINSVRLLDHRMTGRYRSVDDSYIISRDSKNTVDVGFLFLLEDQSMVEGKT